MRLKASFLPRAAWISRAKALAVAPQRYRLYVTGIGSDLYGQGELSAQCVRRDDHEPTVKASDFKFVDTGAVTATAGSRGLVAGTLVVL